MRKIKFAKNEYYHIFNRGVDKRQIFMGDADFKRFLIAMDLLNDEQDGKLIAWRDFKRNHPNAELSDFLKLNFRVRKPLVETIAYCLNPNHYHFLIAQIAENGIGKFMHKLGTSYTKYFNEKNNRTGALFQGTFKSTHLKSNGLLIRMSAYINSNSEIHGIAKAESYSWCSFPEYLGKTKNDFCGKRVILDQFRGRSEYREFVHENKKDFIERKRNEKIYLE